MVVGLAGGGATGMHSSFMTSSKPISVFTYTQTLMVFVVGT